MKTLLLLALALLLTTGAAAQRRPRPQAWRCPVGPAYLPAHLPRRPSQRYLDSLTNLARRRALLTAK
jgi:hypothetical protein